MILGEDTLFLKAGVGVKKDATSQIERGRQGTPGTGGSSVGSSAYLHRGQWLTLESRGQSWVGTAGLKGCSRLLVGELFTVCRFLSLHL